MKKDHLMKRSILSRTLMPLLAIGMLGAAAAANASSSVYISVGAPVLTHAPVYVPPPAHVQPQPMYEAPPWSAHQRPWPVYDTPPAHAYDRRYGQRRAWQSACRAPAWDPHVRYMPGHAVWRHGTLYVATRLSASVWNENSPPEWTPNHWVPASCA